MSDCIFCKIIAGSIPCNRVYEDEEILAFHDIHPTAPYHILIIPKHHIATVADLTTTEDALIAGKLLVVAGQIARTLGFAEKGYRLVFNANRDGGQEVYHVHLHLLAGRAMSWPAG
ncbi:histidine triad nucleotide-binding protein [Chrysiogenes arsenatis]|uniref:histidine triad nucleotide-binding protein n=1 Tax=Chrysiogenes arsenatis TaxID=309797 RepID=UPI00041264F5|nr:histidine triad nucleotide-binding protein [Chrysiogenes arsenatis]